MPSPQGAGMAPRSGASGPCLAKTLAQGPGDLPHPMALVKLTQRLHRAPMACQYLLATFPPRTAQAERSCSNSCELAVKATPTLLC